MMTVYREIFCQSACNHLNSRRLPYHWDLNVYRGCTHGCRYCFAMYSHKYMGSDAFFGEVFVKMNIVEQLERLLRSPKWNREAINLGGITDNYQHAEARYQLMPEILKLLIRYQTPCMISSKSALILRDYDLIDELSRLAYVNIAQTITCADERVRRKLEPGGAPSAKRFEVLKAFRRTNASVGVHLMPIVPLLSDDPENLEAVYAAAKDCGAHYVLPCLMNLRGPTRNAFFRFLLAEYPDLAQPMSQLYAGGRLDPKYRKPVYETISRLQKTYGLVENYSEAIRMHLPKQEPYQQLSLF